MIRTQAIEKYLEAVYPHNDPLLAELEREAAEKNFPIVGPQVGRLLYVIALTSKAVRVLELGSGFGYSALWFSKALPFNAEIHLTDLSEANLAKAEANLKRAGQLKKAKFFQGNALAIAEEFKEPFDIVFNDIEKEDYPKVIPVAERLLRTGGLLVTDNALWDGKVADSSVTDKATLGVRSYNKRLLEHPAFETVILPLRDGVALSVKK